MKYTKEHEWVSPAETDGVWRIGISDYAQEQLGDVVSVELPEVGVMLETGDSCAVIESVKAASDIYSPFAGEVTAVNEDLTDQPEMVNEHAESEGWLFEIKAGGDPEMTGFMDSEEYASFSSD